MVLQPASCTLVQLLADRQLSNTRSFHLLHQKNLGRDRREHIKPYRLGFLLGRI